MTANARSASAASPVRPVPPARHPQPLRIVVVPVSPEASPVPPESPPVLTSAPATSLPVTTSVVPASAPAVGIRQRPVGTQLATPPITAQPCPGQHDRGAIEHAGAPIHSTQIPPVPHSLSTVHGMQAPAWAVAVAVSATRATNIEINAVFMRRC